MNKVLFSVLVFVLLSGCCTSSLWVSDVVQDVNLNQLNATVEMSCAVIPPGLVSFELLENYTNSYVLNGSVPFSGAASDGFYTIFINLSGVQLNPYWQYKLWLNLPGGVRISRTFHAEEPLSWCTILPVAGTGPASLTRYYFNQTTQSCDSFVYTGQRGVSPFDTLEECVAACG